MFTTNIKKAYRELYCDWLVHGKATSNDFHEYLAEIAKEVSREDEVERHGYYNNK